MVTLTKKVILYINLLLTVFVYSQDGFVIKENGLTPKFLTSKIDTLTKNEMYYKTLMWIEEHEKKYKLAVINKIENEVIEFYCIRGNAVSLNKQYYNVKYKIVISFEKGLYTFEPAEVQLKINSKYDMGWKDFDLSSSTKLFKRGKVIRKYKSYLKGITDVLNELSINLSSYLIIE
jgi:hypothetical protein